MFSMTAARKNMKAARFFPQYPEKKKNPVAEFAQKAYNILTYAEMDERRLLYAGSIFG